MATLFPDSAVEMEVPRLIPARMLNEFTYCPRLAYLEWVQGEFAHNLDTLEGRFDHRRVDRATKRSFKGPKKNADASEPSGDAPEHESEAEADPPPFQTRQLMLSAPEEGLIAKMDVVDLNSAEAVPVDYKHGKVPDTPTGYWEPEAVQLCAQGLILRENGYHCEGGFLYFVESRRRVPVPFDETLVNRTRELLCEMRAAAESQTIPPPLDDSPKCNRCSLVGICLPDETTFLKQREIEAKSEPCPEKRVRRLLPQSDDAIPLYVQKQGAIVGKSGDEVTVKFKGELLQKVRLLDVSQVTLFGNIMVTATAVRELASRGVPICHLSYGGWFNAMTLGLAHKNIELRMRQFAAAADRSQSLDMARRFVAAKIKNCRTLLRRHLDDDPAHTLDRLERLIPKALTVDRIESLLGIEGTAARLYFGEFPRLLKSEIGFSLEGRNRRPPRDPVNAMLSFVYAILAKDLAITCQSVGFDPHLGFLHKPRYGRPSLALDLMEEFRPIIADSVVMTVVNNGEVTPDGFIRQAGAVAMTQATRRSVLSAYERRMASLVTHPIFGYRISYRRILEVQARLLGRVLLGEINEYPGFHTR